MIWFKCDECGKACKEEDLIEIVTNEGEYWGVPFVTRTHVSPCCQASFTPGRECKCCGEYTDKLKLYCRNCKKDVKAKFTDFFLKLTNEEFDKFSEIVVEFVNEDTYA